MKKLFVTALGVMAGVLMLAAAASAHCDTMNGPVITAAKKALETGNINMVLMWVQKQDEKAVKEAFKKAVNTRNTGADAAKKAEMEFYETLVKIHREGEGVKFTGIKDTADVEPGIAAADKAVESGSYAELESLITAAVKKGLQEKYRQIEISRKYDVDDVKKGRKFVKAYVEFIHYAEGLLAAAEKGGHHGEGIKAHDGK